MGRKAKYSDQKCESTLFVRLPTEKKAAYVKRAQSEGVPLAEFVIRELDKAVGKKIQLLTINDILVRTYGNQSKAASMLGITRGTLRNYMLDASLEHLITESVDGTLSFYAKLGEGK